MSTEYKDGINGAFQEGDLTTRSKKDRYCCVVLNRSISRVRIVDKGANSNSHDEKSDKTKTTATQNVVELGFPFLQYRNAGLIIPSPTWQARSSLSCTLIEHFTKYKPFT